MKRYDTPNYDNKKLVPIDRIRDWDLMDYSDRHYSAPAPMSDDVLDASVQYLKINRDLLGIEDEE